MCLNLNQFGFQVSISTTISSSFSVTETIFSPYPAPLQPLPFATTEEEVVHFSCQTLPSHGQATALQVSQAQEFSSTEETHTSILSVSTQTQEKPHSCQKKPGHPIPRCCSQPPLSFPCKPQPRSEAFHQSSRTFRVLWYLSI